MGYWLGGAIVLLGIVAAVLWIVLGVRSLSDQVDDFQRVPLGGTGEVSFSEPGGYVVYYEGEVDPPPSFDGDLDPLDGGRSEPMASYNSDLTYDMGGRSGVAVRTVEIVEPGRFRFETRARSGAAGQLAVGRTLGRKLVFTVVGGLAVGFGSCLIGLLTVIVTIVRRWSARKRR
jgi:hypothetical protein